MRGELGKELRKEFDEGIKQQFPQFIQERIIPNPIGLRRYVWQMREGLNAFILLHPSPKNDSFTIEIGSSDRYDFDELNLFMDRVKAPLFRSRSRLSYLYEPKQDHWWHLSNQSSIDDDFFTFVEDPIEISLSRITPALNDVFEKIEKYAIPYFTALDREDS